MVTISLTETAETETQSQRNVAWSSSFNIGFWISFNNLGLDQAFWKLIALFS